MRSDSTQERRTDCVYVMCSSKRCMHAIARRSTSQHVRAQFSSAKQKITDDDERIEIPCYSLLNFEFCTVRNSRLHFELCAAPLSSRAFYLVRCRNVPERQASGAYHHTTPAETD